MNIKGVGCRLSVIGLAVSISPAFAAMQRDEFTRGGQTKTVKLTSTQAQTVMNLLEEKNYSLGDALDKAQNECNGTPVATESNVVSANEYKHTFTLDNMERQSGRGQSENKVLIQVACASADRGGQLEMVAVCPETDKTALLAGAFGQASGRQVRFQNDEWSRDNEQRAPYGQSNRSRYNDDPQTDDWRQDYHGDTDDTWTETDRNEDNWREDQYRDRARDNRFGRNDRWFDRNTRSRERMDIFKGSQVIGANVENHNGEDLGSIEDIAIDPRTGRVQYVVLQSGGFMGIGGKYFAVPWQTLQSRGPDEFLVSIDEKTLERLPGFDDENWPRSADARLFRQQRGFEEQQAGRFDDSDAERRGFLTGRQFRQTGQLNIQPAQARAFAQVLDQNGFTLKQAIEKGEEHCNGKAVAAKCAYSRQATGFQTRGQFQDTDRQVDWDTQTEYSRQDQNQRQGATTGQASRVTDVVVEVTCLKEGETNKATIVVISPENGEVINTREETLTQARRTSGPGNM